MGIYEDVIDWLDRTARTRFRNPAGMAEFLDVPLNQITRWIKKERAPKLDTIGPVLDQLGVKMVFPPEFGAVEALQDTTRDVRFTDVEIAVLRNGKHKDLPQPAPDTFRAIPVVSGEVAAGQGLLAQEGIDSWMILSTREPAVRRSSNLLAVRVGRRQRSMLPLIHPGATVLVDCDDRQPAGESSIYLVRDPHDGIAIKKVRLFTRNKEEFVTFYSLNAEEYPPFTYSVTQDFEGNLRNAVAGKVVWLWQDLTGG